MLQEKYILSTKVKSSYLFARASGVRNHATVTTIAMDIFNTALAKHLSKVLIDVKS